MKETFKESFQNLIYDRLDYNGRDLVATPEYKALRERETEITNKIKELLDPENKHLINDFDEIAAAREALKAASGRPSSSSRCSVRWGCPIKN